MLHGGLGSKFKFRRSNLTSTNTFVFDLFSVQNTHLEAEDGKKDQLQLTYVRIHAQFRCSTVYQAKIDGNVAIASSLR